jgi:hypothetical protein
MSDIYTGPKAFYPQLPLMKFFEDGEWLRVEEQTRGTRYIKKSDAQALLIWIGQNSQKEKTEAGLILI